MPVTSQELQAVENQLVEAGISRSVARSRVAEIERGATGRQIFNLLFEDQIGKVAKEATAELFKVRLPVRRAQAFDQIIRQLLTYTGKRPVRSQARQNLEALGLPADWIDWAVDKRIPFTPAKIAQDVVKLQRKGKTQEQSWREGLKLAAQDRLVETAMRGEVAQLGIVWTAALVISLIGIILAALFGIIELIMAAVRNVRARREEEEFKQERQNLPLTEVEKRELVELMYNKATWAEASQVALDYIKNFREGRSGFRGTEEKTLKAMWSEERKAESDLAREERIEAIMYAGTTARMRSSRLQAEKLRAGQAWGAANLATMEARIAELRRGRLVRTAVDLAVPAVVGGGILTVLVLLARRGR
jgi:hypothetical protein